MTYFTSLFILGFAPITLIQILFSTFMAILFLQSGLDKVINWKGNLDYFTDHFSKSPLKNMVPLLMPIITIFEVAAGAFSALGVLALIFTGNTGLASFGMLLSALSILQLFFGQRLANDYAGAGGLVGYFIATMMGLFAFM